MTMRPQSGRAITPARLIFVHYLRTGRRLQIEQKFNPYHDPKDGQFTFATGGAGGPGSASATPKVSTAHAARQAEAEPARGRIGGNGGPPLTEPMTLQVVFPGLINSPGGAIIAALDNAAGISGPGLLAPTELAKASVNVLLYQITLIDPNYRFDSLGEPQTIEGKTRQIRGLELDRAAAFYRVRHDDKPLQIETLRILQERANSAYEEAKVLLSQGRLRVRLSREVAIGNYVDRATRRELQRTYNKLNISTVKGSPVRVIGREYDTSGTDATYRIPDARVGKIAFDVSLTRKTLATPQVRGFFNGDFKPDAVIIVRPSQLGAGSTYIITRPGT